MGSLEKRRNDFHRGCLNQENVQINVHLYSGKIKLVVTILLSLLGQHVSGLHVDWSNYFHRSAKTNFLEREKWSENFMFYTTYSVTICERNKNLFFSKHANCVPLTGRLNYLGPLSVTTISWKFILIV